MIRFVSLSIVCLLLASCASSQRAPVIDRAPANQTRAKPVTDDWRPDLYTVKSGDTLYSIGLEHGYDYKEIARINNIPEPYRIYTGQQLKLKPDVPAGTAAPPVTQAEAEADQGVVITPLDMGDGSSLESSSIEDSGVEGTPVDDTTSNADVPLISAPKALREPYSDQALRSPPIVQAQADPTPDIKSAPADTPATAPAAEPAPATTPAAVANNAGIGWSWPTKGPLLAGFSDTGSAKGIDIGGVTGQAITAAAPGKVIYSGSDLRGYGMLVIIKHNTDFLSVYAHNSRILVKEGDQVTRGQKIAEMGNTDTDRIKLHFEIRRQGKSVDPTAYLPANPG